MENTFKNRNEFNYINDIMPKQTVAIQINNITDIVKRALYVFKILNEFEYNKNDKNHKSFYDFLIAGVTMFLMSKQTNSTVVEIALKNLDNKIKKHKSIIVSFLNDDNDFVDSIESKENLTILTKYIKTQIVFDVIRFYPEHTERRPFSDGTKKIFELSNNNKNIKDILLNYLTAKVYLPDILLQAVEYLKTYDFDIIDYDNEERMLYNTNRIKETHTTLMFVLSKIYEVCFE